MIDKFLTNDERLILEEAHRASREKRQADKIKVVLLLNKGWDISIVAEALLIDKATVYRYLNTYQDEGVNRLIGSRYKGGISKLSPQQGSQLCRHLKDHTYPNTKLIVKYIQETYHITYTPEGIVHLLHRLGLVYKKTKQVPGRSDPDKQRQFIEETYKRIKSEKAPDDKIYFMDGTHPCHNSIPSFGWIPKGEIKGLPSNTGRKRLNINGAIDISHLDFVFRDDTINADSTINLLSQLEKRNPYATNIYVITDNARYNHSKKVKEFIKTSRICLIYLPPYSPNLNLIERLWRFFHKKILYNRYYETFTRFRQSCISFFKNIHQYKDELISLLTEKFQIIGKVLLQS